MSEWCKDTWLDELQGLTKLGFLRVCHRAVCLVTAKIERRQQMEVEAVLVALSAVCHVDFIDAHRTDLVNKYTLCVCRNERKRS
eukprot:5263821-Pleurochrysis_carterae.AAC.3